MYHSKNYKCLFKCFFDFKKSKSLQKQKKIFLLKTKNEIFFERNFVL
jgi:hypothetical protein